MANEYLLYGSWSDTTGTILLAEGVEESKTMDHTLVYRWTGSAWELQKLLTWNAAGMSILPGGEILIVGEDGEFALGEGTVFAEDAIVDSPTITGVFDVAGLCFAVGLGSKIYRYQGAMRWVPDVTGIDSSNSGFTCIGGNAERMYVAGWSGVCYSRSGSTWEEESLPTSENINGIAVDDQGTAMVCTASGGLLIGRPGIWESVEHAYPGDSFQGALLHKGIFMVFGQSSVYEVRQEEGWEVLPVFAWPLQSNGIFSDAFRGKSDALWVVAEDGLFYCGENGWETL